MLKTVMLWLKRTLYFSKPRKIKLNNKLGPQLKVRKSSYQVGKILALSCIPAVINFSWNSGTKIAKRFKRDLRLVIIKNLFFRDNYGQNIETYFRFHVKWGTARSAQCLLFGNFVLILTKFLVWGKVCALSHNQGRFWDFLKIS